MRARNKKKQLPFDRVDAENLSSFDCGDAQDVQIKIGGDECHDGAGVYAWCSSYPDEGSYKLQSPDLMVASLAWARKNPQ